jgi:DNA-binding MarR family transcriptional regulator
MTRVMQTDLGTTEMAAQLLNTFSGMFAGMRRSDAVRIAAGNLTWAQHEVIEVVLTNARPMRVSDLAARIGLSVASTTVATRRLEQQRLVRRVSDPMDQRSVLIAVTTKGAAAHRASVATAQDVLASKLTALDAAQLRALKNSLAALTRLIQISAVEPSYGVASQSQTDMSPRG